MFLSHAHSDKPIVEPVAIKLREIFGETRVFYDSLSIRPGDGIIDRMNDGLGTPEIVFFFVTSTSLQSEMVKLEWQNALYAASKGKTRIVPIRVDGSPMPAILSQTLYIDMHTIGMEAAIAQIVSVVHGNASFTAQHQNFSNLSYKVSQVDPNIIDLNVTASHLFEPSSSFLVLVDNAEEEIKWQVIQAAEFTGGFQASLDFNGQKRNGMFIRPMSAVLKPGFPITIRMQQAKETTITFIDLLHEVSQGNFNRIPLSS